MKAGALGVVFWLGLAAFVALRGEPASLTMVAIMLCGTNALLTVLVSALRQRAHRMTRTAAPDEEGDAP